MAAQLAYGANLVLVLVGIGGIWYPDAARRRQYRPEAACHGENAGTGVLHNKAASTSTTVGLAQGQRDGDDPLLSALAIHGDEQVVQVHIRHAGCERLCDSASGVQEQQCEQMQTPVMKVLLGFPIHNHVDLCL